MKNRPWAWHDNDEQDEEEDDQLHDCYLRGFPTFKPKISTTVLNAFNGISPYKMEFF